MSAVTIAPSVRTPLHTVTSPATTTPRPRPTEPARTVRPPRSIAPDRHRTELGPRLLLPPVAEPRATIDAFTQVVLATPTLRSVLSPVTEEAWPIPTANRDARSRGRLPDPEQLCGAVVLAAVEVLTGTRPITQLARWVTPEVLEALTTQLATTDRPAAGQRHRTQSSGRAQRPGVDRGGRVAPTPRATVRRIKLSRLDDRTVEACVVLHDGVRVRAAAARLKVHRGHWRVTVLQIG